MHKSIKLRVIKHLEACSGNALILFDEVQKAKHGALDALIPGMDEKGSLSENIETTSYFGYPIVTLHTVSTVNTIFVFISDIGADILEKQLVYYEDRDDIPKKVLRATIKKAMNAKWDDINFGKLIKEVIPYFPMERKEIEDVFRLKIRAYALHYTLIKWYYLIVDESVINYLCSPRFVEYRPVAQNFSSSLEGTVRSSTKIFAVEGGRNLENGGDCFHKTNYLKFTHDNSTYYQFFLFLFIQYLYFLLPIGPLNDLQSLLMRVMQPWQTSMSVLTVYSFFLSIYTYHMTKMRIRYLKIWVDRLSIGRHLDICRSRST